LVDLVFVFSSQARQEMEGQAATLQNLRGYIGEMSPERGEEERLEETVQVRPAH
jgi:hypothetical protein